MRHALIHVTDPATGKVYPVPAGGAEDDTATADDTSTDEGTSDDDADATASDDDDGSDDDKPLGPEGEKALRAMKKRARDAEKELRRIRAEADKPKSDDGDKPDPDAIRQEVETEVRQQYARDRALDKLEAKAARKFQNPDLARKLLSDQADDFLDEKGNPDVEAITEALEELLSDEPYLAVQDDQRFKGDADGGARNGSKPAQLTRQDIKRMSPQQITQAEQEGRLDVLLGRT